MLTDANFELLTTFLEPPSAAISPGYRAFAQVSRTFLSSYNDLVTEGLPPESVAFAMMGATVNFYKLFGMSAELPELLRALADSVQNDPT
jgi:hypothetical protein